jgi:two-component system, chemotaxis family, response regulator Rcp1
MTGQGTAEPSGRGTTSVSARPDNTGGRREILLVEDSQGDVRLIREALREICGGHVLHVVNDGVEALAFLHRTGAYVSAPRPDLILLDLNLPRKNGREVLYEIKHDEQLRDIPVIVLTISTAEEDILTAYRLQANCYVIKPVNLDNFFRVLNSVARYWLASGRAGAGDGNGG